LGRNKTWGSTGNIFGPLLFLLYINDLPKVVNDKSIPILFADDTSILVTSTNKNYFETKITATFNLINEWLGINLLSINFTKTRYFQFTTKNKPNTQIKVAFDNNQITTISNIKFLGIYINDTGNCKHHIEYILPKLSAACYAMRIIKQYVSLESLKIVYYSNFNSIMNYGLLFLGISSHNKKIFSLM
jgi:hypothetical protein